MNGNACCFVFTDVNNNILSECLSLSQEGCYADCFIETEMSSRWLPWWSLEILKTSFNVPSEDQGSYPDGLSIFVSALSMDTFEGEVLITIHHSTDGEVALVKMIPFRHAIDTVCRHKDPCSCFHTQPAIKFQLLLVEGVIIGSCHKEPHPACHTGC